MSATIQRFDKQKYLQLAERDGLSSALTTLHNDLTALESIYFDGPQGPKPEIWEDIRLIRRLSVEFWERLHHTP